MKGARIVGISIDETVNAFGEGITWMKPVEDPQKRPHLLYDTNDDGVWLVCNSCGFGRNLGFDFPARDVATVLQDHDKECGVR